MCPAGTKGLPMQINMDSWANAQMPYAVLEGPKKRKIKIKLKFDWFLFLNDLLRPVFQKLHHILKEFHKLKKKKCPIV